jgi:nucleoside-diphosphate-sugar epimerase
VEKKWFSGRRALITGGLGFIGSNLARKLVKLGVEVTLVDSLIPEYGGSLFNIADIQDRVRVNISDVRDEHSMKYLVQGQDFLFNLAGQTSHLDSMQDPFTDLEINAQSQLYILEACRHYNPKIKIIFASTRQIYGKPQYLPVDEKHPLRPVDINGVNKLAGEWYHLLYHSVHGIRTSVLRLTNTIGPRMRIRDGRQTFVGIWIRLLLEDKSFEVWGGEQLRDFTYVDDCVEAMLLAAYDEKADGRIFNLGGASTISLKDLANLLIEINGSGEYLIREFPGERKKIDIGDYYSDHNLIQQTLGWTPEVDLKEGFRRTVHYYKEHFNQYV